jgi:hypothetical protein
MSLIGQQEEAFRKGRVKETELQRPLLLQPLNHGIGLFHSSIKGNQVPVEYRAEDLASLQRRRKLAP